MKNIKRLIVIVLLIIIILIIALFIVITKKNNREDFSEQQIEKNFEISNKMNDIKNASEYFNVKDIINMYSQNINTLKQTGEEKYKKALLNIFPDFVKKDLNINNENINTVLSFPTGFVRINNLKVSSQTVGREAYEMTTDIRLYLADIDVVTNLTKENLKMMILLDYINETYYIMPKEYLQTSKTNIEDGKNILMYSSETIEKNENNIWNIANITDENICKEYFNLYKLNVQYDIESAYNSLDEEYRKNKFDSVEKYKEYIKNTQIMGLTLVKYNVSIDNNNRKFTCIDEKGNYYVFQESGIPMQAKVKLNV